MRRRFAYLGSGLISLLRLVLVVCLACSLIYFETTQSGFFDLLVLGFVVCVAFSVSGWELGVLGLV